jgi:hypothetical protein
MALIVVGGQTKHVGKTTLVCEIIRRFASARWTAAKITSHSHQPQECAPIASGTGWTIWEQTASDAQVDTARYLKAGAVRSLLVSAESESLASACAALKAEFPANENAIVESTAGAEVLAPDLFLLVVNPESQEFKSSANQQLARAHAIVVNSPVQRISVVESVERALIVQTVEAGIDPRLASAIEGLLKRPGT